MNTTKPQPTVYAAILAGGNARRMQGVTKPLIDINGTNPLEYLVAVLAPQVHKLLLSVNNSDPALATAGLIAVEDLDLQLAERRAGPLLGVASALHWLEQHNTQCQWLVTIPGDTLNVPVDFVPKLLRKATQSREHKAFYVCAGNRHHYLAAIWHISCLTRLKDFLKKGNRAAKNFLQEVNAGCVNFPASNNGELFFNINTLEDYEKAKSILTGSASCDQ